MFTRYTWQDWNAAPASERTTLLLDIIRCYKASEDFRQALEANRYFAGENTAVAGKMTLQPVRFDIRDGSGNEVRRSLGQKAIVGARVFSGFFFRFVTQQNQYLLSNGVQLHDEALKARLGVNFDNALEQMGERALIQGVCWAFWNADHVEVIEAAHNELSGFVPLMNEETGEIGAGIQFWQVDASRPLYVRLFEQDGLTLYRQEGDALMTLHPLRPYRQTVARDGAGVLLMDGENYPALPLIPLYANAEQRSELTQAIKSKIDAYDRISSDFVDNLDRANDVYWVLNNFGGSTSDMLEMIEQINRLRIVANLSDGMGGSSVAEPHAFEVPYEARQTALELLDHALHADFMALSVRELTGGSLTNVAIETALTNLNLKCDRYEWQCAQFVFRLLGLLGERPQSITFKRQLLANRSEIVADIYRMQADLDWRTRLRLNPYINPEDIEGIIQRRTAELREAGGDDIINGKGAESNGTDDAVSDGTWD